MVSFFIKHNQDVFFLYSLILPFKKMYPQKKKNVSTVRVKKKINCKITFQKHYSTFKDNPQH